MIFLYIIYILIAALTFVSLYRIQKRNVAELNREYAKDGIKFHMYYGSMFLEALIWPFYWTWIIHGAFFRK